MNDVKMLGRIGADGELRYMPNGTAVLSFSIAIQDKKNESEQVSWFKVNVYSKSAEKIAPRIKKGKEVFVAGRLQSRSWVDSKTGQKRYIVEIIAGWVRVVETFNPNESAYDSQPQLTSHGAINNEDVPF
jgi:single-strand DNA-binding protein